jgi:CheY-like chemotaxis protein
MVRRVLIVSPHPPSRVLLSRMLAEPGLVLQAVADGDEAFAAMALQPPALVIVDLRRPGEDDPLFLGLLRRRQPRLPVISLLPGRLRVTEGTQERVEEVSASSPDELRQLLASLQQALHDVLSTSLLRILRPPVGQA